MVDDSILRSIKRDLVGIAPDDTAFDQTLINITNSVFTILWELGVGPQEGFHAGIPGPKLSQIICP